MANFHNNFSSKDFLSNLDSPINLNILDYTGARKKSNQDSLIRLLHSTPIYNYTNQSQLPTFNIITGTKSSLFLPYWNLDSIIFVDEPNSYYIQDQNSLYYDARDAVFILSQAFESSLHFISRLPSIRLNSMYDKKKLEDLVNNYANIDRKPPRMQILEKNTKNDEYSLISNQILQILTNDEDYNEIFSNPE
ncbi:hypothetical protein HC766_01485 [Candidatus Gracilibacteria bacterium]|nr:hypothetical protein [Candidatus Gracilibacteria bacterium]